MGIVNTFAVGPNGKMKVGDETRYPGDLVPEAASWRHLDPWLNTGALIRVSVDDSELEAADEAPDLSAMKKADLLALAAEKGIDVPKSATKADLIAVLSTVDAVT